MPICKSPRIWIAAIAAGLAVTSARANLTINPVFDSTITSDPNAPAIESTIRNAIAFYSANFTDNVTVTINFQEMSGGLSSSRYYYYTAPYSTYVTALASHAVTCADTEALAYLPSGGANPANGSATIDLQGPLARALGFASDVPDPGQPDGWVYFNVQNVNLSAPYTQANKASFYDVCIHEIDENLGLTSALNGVANNQPSPTGDVFPEDLFRYDSGGNRSFTTNFSASSYFSLNGKAAVAQFNQNAGGDYSDWYSAYGGVTPQPQDAFITDGTNEQPGAEITALDAVGFSPVVRTVVSKSTAGVVVPYLGASWNYSGVLVSPKVYDTLLINNGGTVSFQPTALNSFIRLSGTSTLALYGAEYGQNLNISSGQLVVSSASGPAGNGYGMMLLDQASLWVSGSGLINLDGPLHIGTFAGNTAAATISGGRLNVGLNPGTDQTLYVANAGTGNLNQTGGIITAPMLVVAAQGGSLGGCNISGGTLKVGRNASVGGTATAAGGSGVLNISGSAAVTIAGGLKIWNTPGSLVRLSAGSLTVRSLDTSSGPGLFQWTGGALEITGAGSNLGGSVTVPAGSTLTLDSPLSDAVTIAPLGKLKLSANSGSGVQTQSVGMLNIGGVMTVTPASIRGNRLLVFTPGLTLSGALHAWTGLVDLGNNDMDISNANVLTVTDQVRQACNPSTGLWNGTGGITSSSAASDSSHLSAIGVIQNNQSPGTVFTPSHPFDANTPGSADVLLKYTYYGDANLDGKIDGSDYSLIDNASLQTSAPTGWYNGDFNYDGVINGSDYTLIDNGFNRQGANISASIASSTDLLAGEAVPSIAVPEPALSLAALVCLMPSRQRRRR